MGRKKQSKKFSITKYLPVLLILLSITIIAGSTFAYFTDRKEGTSDLTFSKVELSSETTIGINGELRDVIPGSKLVDGAVAFSKSIDSEAIYVRAKISFSLSREFANDTDMQKLIKELRNATDFNTITTEQHGAVWSAKDGNYFYLLNKDETTKLMRVDTIDTFVLANEVVVPRDLKNLPNNAQYMKGVNFHIAFEAIQADNVSDVLSETKVTFDTLFPMPAVEKAGIYVSVMNNDLMSVKQEITLTEAGTIEEPKAEDIVVDGTTSHIFDGWYTDATFSEEFDFTKKVTASVSLYPKYIEVSEGLVFTEIYETATAGEGPAAVGDIIGYSVAQGTCDDTEIILPLEYNAKPILEIAEDGFRDNANLTNITLNNTIVSIGNSAFVNCANLELTGLPSELISIGQYAFSGCSKLEFTTIPDAVKNIGYKAFDSCNLKILTLSSNVTSMESDIFDGCENLEYLLCGSKDVASLAFGKGVDKGNIYYKEISGYESVTFADVQVGGVILGVGNDGDCAWIKDGENYYKEYVAVYTITYMNPDLTSVYTTVEVEDGTVTSEQSAPTHENVNAVFEGWYTEADFINKFIFGTSISEDITLYPKYNFIYKVVFISEGVTISSQDVLLNDYPQIPNNPTKSEYDFDGWTINGSDVLDPNIQITANTTFIAKFTKLYNVVFIYEGETYNTQTIRSGESPRSVSVESTTYKVFNGWKLNGTIVNVTAQTITSNTTFIADIIYKYDVVFKVDDTVYNSQIVRMNGYASLPTNPSKDGYDFTGWTINGGSIVTVSTIKITADTVFIAVFEKSALSTVSEMTWSGLTSFNGNYVWADGTDCYFSSESVQYVLDKSTNTWTPMTWNGFTNLAAMHVWVYEDLYYYSKGADQYVLDQSTNTWLPMTWGGVTSIYGNYIWTDGTNYYHSSGTQQYVLDQSTNTWSEVAWSGLTSIYGQYIWTDGVNNYYSQGTNQYVLDKSTKTWNTTTWSGLTSFDGTSVWTDNENIYASNTYWQAYMLNTLTNTWTKIWNENDLRIKGDYVWRYENNYYYSSGVEQLILNKSTNTWLEVDWIGLTSFSGSNVWTIGNNCYYSSGDAQLILDKSTNTWTPMTWGYLKSFSGSNVWTIGNNYYYSSGTVQCVLDQSTNTWSSMTWSGLTSFYGSDIWTDGTNYYYSKDSTQYVLDKSTNTWTSMTWIGCTSFNGSRVWTDGTNYYYSYNMDQYVLDKSTNTWTPMTWNGSSPYWGSNVWTDGTDYYFSSGSSQYVLDKSTNTWSKKKWSGLTSFNGNYIWTDGTNYYCSDGYNQYIFS